MLLSLRAACPAQIKALLWAICTSVPRMAPSSFEDEPAYIGEAPNFMIALKAPGEYSDDEIDERGTPQRTRLSSKRWTRVPKRNSPSDSDDDW